MFDLNAINGLWAALLKWIDVRLYELPPFVGVNIVSPAPETLNLTAGEAPFCPVERAIKPVSVPTVS